MKRLAAELVLWLIVNFQPIFMSSPKKTFSKYEMTSSKCKMLRFVKRKVSFRNEKSFFVFCIITFATRFNVELFPTKIIKENLRGWKSYTAISKHLKKKINGVISRKRIAWDLHPFFSLSCIPRFKLKMRRLPHCHFSSNN